MTVSVFAFATADISRNFGGQFSRLWDYEIRFNFFNTRRRPDMNGRGNELFYSVIFGGRP